jgi:PAP2 superfamily
MSASALPLALPRPSGFWRMMRLGLSAHAIYFLFAAAYLGAFVLMSALVPGTRPSSFAPMAAGFLAVCIPPLAGWVVVSRLFRLFFITRPADPTRALIRDIASYATDGARMAHGVPMILAMIPVVFAYSSFKNNIPVLTSFSWDARFAEIDRIAHFGMHPWQILEPLFANPAMTLALNVNYSLWFFVMWIMWLFLGFSQAHGETRARFFMTFMLVWSIGGSLLAFAFSSAGPCYYGLLGLSPDPYAPLLAQLNSFSDTVPVWSLNVQKLLWDGYLGGGAIEGISAMPSMHNATALLFALAGFRINRWLGWGLMVHATLILAGSVSLAWHYAIDGYAGWALTLAAWYGAGRIWAWLQTTDAVKAFHAALAERTA